MKSHLIQIAAAGLLVALASSTASAQRANITAAVDAIPRPELLTANTVSPAWPFGTIDVSRAGSSAESVRIWSLGRTASERSELNGRCQFITNPVNAPRYNPYDQQFCHNFMAVG